MGWSRSETSGRSSRTRVRVRIMVDIADKALSPAVNDPTTAVQVIDHLADVLRLVGTVDLSRIALVTANATPSSAWCSRFAAGRTTWRSERPRSASTGAGSIQVVRRMRAMLEELHDEVLPEHRPAVEEELARLDATVIAVVRRLGRSRPRERRQRPGDRRPVTPGRLRGERQASPRGVALQHPPPAVQHLVHRRAAPTIGSAGSGSSTG